MSDIHRNVVEIAAKKNMSLCKVEQEAGLAAGAISKWKYNNPRVDSLIAVARVLGVTINRLTRKNEKSD